MRKSCETLGHVLKLVSPQQAADLRDGPDGWSIVEVVCHLRDFDEFFYQRALLMLGEDYPTLPAYDHVALAVERAYQSQNIQQAYATLVESRQRFIAFFKGLDEAQWERAGIHPESGHFTMTDAAMQVCSHDTNHIEQITRILTQTL